MYCYKTQISISAIIIVFDVTFYSKVSRRYVSKEVAATIHKKAEAFLTWLREAEEEESDEEEEDKHEHTGVEVVYTHKPVVEEEVEVAEDDGIDIDAI